MSCNDSLIQFIKVRYHLVHSFIVRWFKFRYHPFKTCKVRKAEPQAPFSPPDDNWDWCSIIANTSMTCIHILTRTCRLYHAVQCNIRWFCLSEIDDWCLWIMSCLLMQHAKQRKKKAYPSSIWTSRNCSIVQYAIHCKTTHPRTQWNAQQYFGNISLHSRQIGAGGNIAGPSVIAGMVRLALYLLYFLQDPE